jgi:hypothetical protein
MTLRRYTVAPLIVTVVWLLTSPLFLVAAQTATPPASTALKVTGDVRTPLSLNADALKTLPRKRIEVTGDDGHTVIYEGVLVGTILERAGAALGAEMRSGGVATYVVASATDGYQVVFSLAELDPTFTGSEIIVADTADGNPLPARQGALRIVVPKDTRPARSIRMLERLAVVHLDKSP